MGRTSYPGQLDSDIEIPRIDDNITEIGGDAINSLRDAIFSIQNAIGINPQGNLVDLVARINGVIDADGNIKSSALASRGLITLPITNAQISSAAAIKESKLDLDYPTTTLYGKIESNQVDTDAMRTSFNAFYSRDLKHFVGPGDRHHGHQIDLDEEILNSADVEAAMHEMNSALTDHMNPELISHSADTISVSNTFENFSASNAQEAFEQLEVIDVGRIETHQDMLHLSAISLNERGEQGLQGNLIETVLSSTIFKTEISKATNILQVMRPNVARVTSKNIDPRSLKITESYMLRIQAGGVNRSYLDINLSAILPVDDIDIIVDAINSKAQVGSNHYPISAYNTNGKLTIAHNIPGAEFTIQILDTVSFSAATALGFGDVTSTIFSWSEDNHAGYVGGNRIIDLKPLIKIHYSHTQGSFNEIAPDLGDLRGYGLIGGNEGRIICNITNHSVNSDNNGTYYIIAFPDYETFLINANITFGEFDIEIAADSVNFQNSANGEVYDIFVEYVGDGYGKVVKYERVSYGIISGVSLRTINKNFPTQNISWQVSDSNSIQLFENDLSGLVVSIPVGYIGQVKVLCADNINSALFEITAPPDNATRSMTVYPFAGNNDKLYVSSVHYAGNFGIYTLKFVTDKRYLGTSVESSTYDLLDMIPANDIVKELWNNLDPKYQAIKQVKKLVTNRKNQLL